MARKAKTAKATAKATAKTESGKTYPAGVPLPGVTHSVLGVAKPLDKLSGFVAVRAQNGAAWLFARSQADAEKGVGLVLTAEQLSQAARWVGRTITAEAVANGSVPRVTAQAPKAAKPAQAATPQFLFVVQH